jgi:ABC-type antimicrobial peptide transport system permease subunit
LSNRLVHHISEALPGATGVQVAHGLSKSAASLQQLSPATLEKVLQAFALSFRDVFLFGIPFAVIAFAIALFLKEAPLSGEAKQEAAGEGLMA